MKSLINFQTTHVIEYEVRGPQADPNPKNCCFGHREIALIVMLSVTLVLVAAGMRKKYLPVLSKHDLILVFSLNVCFHAVRHLMNV